jgi:3-oxoadipate enol-lactonase / 4-carboxymuconolactone decarboxylase
MTDVPLLYHRLDGPEDAPVLVLAPALGTTCQIWQEQVPELAKFWRVLRYDLPGHGSSPRDPVHTVEEIAVLLLELLDALGIDRFGYTGVGLGGCVGTLLALSHPHRVASLALIGSSAGPGSPDAWREHALVVRATGLEREARTAAARWFTARSLAEEPALAEPCADMVRTVDPGCYAACCDALAEHDLRGQLPAVIAPTLVIAGAEDTTAPAGAARELIAGIPDSRLAVVPNAAHLANVEQPGPVTQLLLRHFAGTWREVPAPRSAPPPQRAEPVAAATKGTETFAEGLKVRREVLGDAHVDLALGSDPELTGDFQDLVTRYAWGEVWNRPGLDRRARSIATITALVARGQFDELALHIRAGLRNGLTRDELRELLIHCAVYCGVPAANSAFAAAAQALDDGP